MLVKELQWDINNHFFFCNVYYKCIEGNLGICLLLVVSIDDVWMVDLMIIHIENTIAKALDMNDIIKKTWGCQLDESKSLNK